MFFHCLKCNTKYRIDDEKIVNKVLKFSCRTCGVSLLIRDPRWGSPSLYLDNKQSSGVRRIAAEPGKSSTVRIETKQFKELKGDEMNKSQVPIQTKEVWFAIRKGERIGPLTKKDILEMLLSGKLHEKSFVWRPTMKNWMRINAVEEMRDILIDSRGVPPPPLEAVAKEASVHPRQGDSALSKDLFKLLTGETSVSAWKPPEEKMGAKESEEAAKIAEEKTDFVESFEEKRFFSKAFDLHPPVAQKGHTDHEIYTGLFPAAAEELEEKPKEEISEKISISSLKPVKEIRPSKNEVKHLVKEFSLMMRLERRSRLAQILLVSGVFILVGGLTALYILTSGKEETPKMFLDNGSKMTEVPLKRPLYAVKHEEAEKRAAKAATEKPSSKLREILRKKSASKKVGTDGDNEAEEKPVPKIVSVDPELKKEYMKMADLIPAIENDKEEIKIDVKPEIKLAPQNRLSSEKIDNLLGNKLKKFSECKAKKSVNPDMLAKIVVTFTVNVEGRVKDIVIENESGVKDDGVEACMRKIIGGWIFPPIEEAQTFKRIIVL